jgi:hypothetical protein
MRYRLGGLAQPDKSIHAHLATPVASRRKFLLGQLIDSPELIKEKKEMVSGHIEDLKDVRKEQHTRCIP